LNTLDYHSDRTHNIPDSSPTEFRQLLEKYDPAFNPKKAHFTDWQKADILFQLTDTELATPTPPPENTLDRSNIKSYLFLAIQLKTPHYPRNQLTTIARQINRPFPMPAMLFIRHGDHLSITITHRRPHKNQPDKDVLGKVTILHNINLENPHRGHLEILTALNLPHLRQQKPIHNFAQLHTAWKKP
ncbi:MAG: hypothetical protein GDA55_03250, partial [Cellvibrionales bacterium]|nr:hypothetical protein [Cellvibrionales bacterium]